MKKILLATDGSEHSFKAVEATLGLVRATGAAVTVLSVIQDIVVYGGMENIYIDNGSMRKAAEEVLRRTKEQFAQAGVEADTQLGEGSPAEVINATAKEGGYDLVVMGSRGLGGINRLLLGSVSGRVANTSEVSVLIVK